MEPPKDGINAITEEVNACIRIVHDIQRELTGMSILKLARDNGFKIVEEELWKDIVFYIRGLSIMETLKNSNPMVHARMQEFHARIDRMENVMHDFEAQREARDGEHRNV